MAHTIQERLQQLPSVDGVLQHDLIQQQLKNCPRKIAVEMIRQTIAQLRQDILSGKNGSDKKDISTLVVRESIACMAEFSKVYYRKVINAAGIVLHTGLGRAVLAESAMQQIQQELSGYSLLQVGIEDGKRSMRDVQVEKLLTLLTGAQAATVVNNNAAATALVLNTIAAGKEVIVSRGQLVEIGGAFRLPDVMAFSGAKLVEVGTTNKTHLRDYENAISDQTAAILRVHPSNYKIQGFTSEVPLVDMVELAHANNLLVYDDVGAGSLIDFSKYGFQKEPTLADSVNDGADIITASGDKLIGASQAGIILGTTDIIKRIRKNQFARIVRAGKMTLAVLEATLKLFLDEEKAKQDVPTLRMLLRPADSIGKQTQRMITKLRKAKLACTIESVDGFSQTGSGSLPAQNLPTKLVCLKPESMSSVKLANRLRHCPVPIFTRIQDDSVLIDPRTLLDGDEKIICDSLTEILGA